MEMKVGFLDRNLKRLYNWKIFKNAYILQIKMTSFQWFLTSNYLRHDLYGSRVADSLSFLAGVYKGFINEAGIEIHDLHYYLSIFGGSGVFNFLKGMSRSQMLDHGTRNEKIEGLKQSLRGVPFNGIELIFGEAIGRAAYNSISR